MMMNMAQKVESLMQNGEKYGDTQVLRRSSYGFQILVVIHTAQVEVLSLSKLALYTMQPFGPNEGRLFN